MKVRKRKLKMNQRLDLELERKRCMQIVFTEPLDYSTLFGNKLTAVLSALKRKHIKEEVRSNIDDCTKGLSDES